MNSESVVRASPENGEANGC